MTQQPLAYLFPEFLESAEARPIRILAEYLEPLRRFKEQRIQDTVVFFGSARVDSRGRASLRDCSRRGAARCLERITASSSPPAAARGSWRPPTAAHARPAGRRLA